MTTTRLLHCFKRRFWPPAPRRYCSAIADNPYRNLPLPCEVLLNQQITNELNASHVYLSMGTFFAQTDVTLPGVAGFFLQQADDERQHAGSLIAYQLLRGGRVALGAVESPRTTDCATLELAFCAALELEHRNLQSLIELCRLATENSDKLLEDFVSEHLLNDQVADIAKLGGLLSRVRRVCADGEGVGTFQMDRWLAKRCRYAGPMMGILKTGWV